MFYVKICLIFDKPRTVSAGAPADCTSSPYGHAMVLRRAAI